MGIYVNGIDMPKQDEILQIRVYGDGKVSRVYDIKCQQIGTAIETPNEAPTETVEGWIPVSERLPEEDARYLCQNSYGLMQVIRWTNNLEEVDDFHFYNKKYGGWYEYDSEWGYCERKEVVAWRPLPKPYREDGEV